MLRKFKRLSALVALGLLAGLLVPGQARAATTYEVQAFASFFEAGVPAFSGRIYPSSAKVQRGDTILFSDIVALFPEGVYPQDWIPENIWRFDAQLGAVVNDPDDGEGALKFGPEDRDACGRTAEDPCVWGPNNDVIFPEFPEFSEDPNAPEPDFSTWVTVDAAPGTVLWANTLASSEVNTNFTVEVVAPNETASTQAELDARGAQLLRKDYEDALALHNKMGAKKTFHINAAGQKVYDIWVAPDMGPVEFLASYPKKISVPRGARVMYHFNDENEPHSATFPGDGEILNNGFMPVCDPDGDDGPGPDTEPTFGPGGPTCTEPAELEFDIDPRVILKTGDNRHTGRLDYESSGVKVPVFPEQTDFDSDPWTVRMTKTSTDKGFKYVCIVHGGFMGGRVVVR